MPSGHMPTYDYRPPLRLDVTPTIRTCSSRRARLTNETYFRARDPGLAGNNISVQLIEFNKDDPDKREAVFVVMNHNLKYSENVIGPASVKFLDFKGKATDLIEITNLTTTPRAQFYTTSLGIRNPEERVAGDSYPFTFDKLWSKGKTSVQLSLDTSQAASDSIISIAPRIKTYSLVWATKTPPATEEGGTTAPISGWDIDDLRAKVNADDPWIEMIERTPMPEVPPGSPPVPRPEGTPLNDAQDDGVDEPFLLPFEETFLSGGDGLPDSPTPEKTGPTRALVHVNYGEKKDGSLGETNTVYEWAGDNAKVGVWKAY